MQVYLRMTILSAHACLALLWAVVLHHVLPGLYAC